MSNPPSASPLLAKGGALIGVAVVMVGGLLWLASPAANPSPASPSAARGPNASSVAASIGPGSAASPMLDAVSTARIDGGNWEITHLVTASDYPALGVGDLTTRVYQDVKYRCGTPPCEVALKTDDPSTVDKPRAATFEWRGGEYVSIDKQRGLGRCNAPDGSVVADAYDVVIQTTLRVVAVGDRNGAKLATRLVGDQSRHGTPTKAAASRDCPPWSAAFRSSGQRNVTPGQATDVRFRNWAGYVVSRDDVRITEIHGAWVQPAVRCDSVKKANSSFWIGIDGSGNDTLQQIGTEADCIGGQARYYTWWETIPEPQIQATLRVKPGDHMSASITSRGDRYTMTLRNETTGDDFSKTVNWPRAEGATAEWVAEATSLCRGADDCEVQVLPDFGAARFTDASAATATSDLLPVNDPSWSLERAVMITRGGRTKAEVSPLGIGGNTFTVTWRPLS